MTEPRIPGEIYTRAKRQVSKALIDKIRELNRRASTEGDSVWQELKAPPEAIAQVKRLMPKVERYLARQRHTKQREGLTSEAASWRQATKWRAAVPPIAPTIAGALSDFALTIPTKDLGSPHKRRGASQIPERMYVNLAYEYRVKLLRKNGRDVDVDVLLQGSGDGKQSSGRRQIADGAHDLAKLDGVTLSKPRVAAAIRDLAKAEAKDLAAKRFHQRPLTAEEFSREI